MPPVFAPAAGPAAAAAVRASAPGAAAAPPPTSSAPASASAPTRATRPSGVLPMPVFIGPPRGDCMSERSLIVLPNFRRFIAMSSRNRPGRGAGRSSQRVGEDDRVDQSTEDQPVPMNQRSPPPRDSPLDDEDTSAKSDPVITEWPALPSEASAHSTG